MTEDATYPSLFQQVFVGLLVSHISMMLRSDTAPPCHQMAGSFDAPSLPLPPPSSLFLPLPPSLSLSPSLCLALFHQHGVLKL